MLGRVWWPCGGGLVLWMYGGDVVVVDVWWCSDCGVVVWWPCGGYGVVVVVFCGVAVVL